MAMEIRPTMRQAYLARSEREAAKSGDDKKQEGRWSFLRSAPFLLSYFAPATAVTKFMPFGVPSPVTLSHPGPVVSELSVPKLMAYQRVEVP
jgi:hypothetical protein